MSIKLLALDVDDTLVSDIVTISDANQAAIARAQKAGIYVTIATGRGYLGSNHVWRTLKIEGPVINYGGAIVTDTRTNQLIHATEVPNELVQEILGIAEKENVYAQIYQGDTIVTESDDAIARNYTRALSLPLVIDPMIRKKVWENVPKVLFIAEHERAEELIPKMQAHFAGRLKVSGSKAGFVEFNHLCAHKGAALQWLAERLGIARHEVAAMGDNSLDLEMLEWAGIGAAVGNATEKVKGIADLIVPACVEDGVAWFINNHMLK
ncbi:MAG: Cof-type HAD-IIB family hydrolase [Bacillota bacterium]